ncbi:hypothetical protein evm_015401 [Chilo suppressalis]|nr:hypothetical protein evm_015401 [Chilo suppressalis]
MTSLILLKSILFSNALQKTRKKKKKGRRSMNKKTSPVCRICFKEQGTVPIFNNILYPSIPIEIRNFSGVTINESQDTSNYMCKNCLDLLNGCIMFRELCQKNNKHLVEVAVKSADGVVLRCIQLAATLAKRCDFGVLDFTVVSLGPGHQTTEAIGYRGPDDCCV